MDVWVDGRMNGWMDDGRMDEWKMGGWMSG